MLKLFLVFTASYLVLMLFVGLSIYQSVQIKIKKNIAQSEYTLISDLDILISEVINQVNSDVSFLAKQTELFHSNDKHEFIRHLEETYLQYAKSKKIYDQIRYIDKNGNENVRVNLNNGDPYNVAQDKLQNKKTRYYFMDILSIPRDSIYYSPFDLNIENNEIERPQKPMIRIGTPIFDRNNKKMGIIILNLLGENVLKTIDKIEPLSESLIYFINANGYYLKCPNPNQEWGFMYKRSDHNINTSFPDEDDQIFSATSGKFFSSSGFFCHNTIYPFQTHENKKRDGIRFWKIVSFTPHATINDYIEKEYSIWITILLTSIIPVIILFWFLARNIQLKNEARQNLIQSNKELKELNATKDKFFSILAHDLRNPFGAILGFSNLLVSQNSELSKEEYKKIGNAINKSANNAFELLENLLTWAMTQKGSIKYAPQHIVLFDITRSIIRLLQANANAKQIKITNSIPTDLAINTDPEMIKTILRNLISNAIKFTNEKGAIEIFIADQSSDGTLEIKVKDNGVGMAKKEMDKLFLLDQGISTQGTAQESGSGLGLILCKEFVERNGGILTVESKVNIGSTFTFTVQMA